MNTLRRWAAIAAGLALVALPGCGQKSAKDQLPGSVLAVNVVPVYKNCELTEQMGDESWGDDPESYTRGQTWWFKTRESKEKLLAFYQEKFPDAERQVLDTGATELRIHPQGTTRFEDVTIVIDDGELRIGESVRPQRLKAAGKPAS